MKIFFVGGFEGNAGPINVNKSLRNNFTSSLIYVKSSNKYFKYIETFFKTIVYNLQTNYFVLVNRSSTHIFVCYF